NESDLEAPFAKILDQIIERVLELGEDENPLIRLIEEALLLEDRVQLGEFGLRFGFLELPGTIGKLLEQSDFFIDLSRVLGKRNGLDKLLEVLALLVVHLVEVFGVRQVRCRERG